MTQPHVQKLGLVAFVIDERLSREKRSILSRIITALRSFTELDLIESSITEEKMIEKLETKNYNLILAPVYRYKAWTKIEAFLGLNRTSGPTFAGYFSEPIKHQDIGAVGEYLRTIMLDFAHTTTLEAVALIRALVIDKNRSGLKPLLSPNSAIFCENWFMGQGQGFRFDSVMALPGIRESDWTKRANAMRICINAFWSLIYEEGPGKGDLGMTTAGKTPRAYFQVGVDTQVLALRLVYGMSSRGSPREVLNQFWYDAGRPSSAAQLLLQFADFVRVHTIPQSSDLEVVAGFFASAPAEKAFGEFHTLWIEPISATTVNDIPFENPGPNYPQLKSLPSQPTNADTRPTETAQGVSTVAAKERFMQEAAGKIRELKTVLEERDRQIREMRSGGISTAPPLPIPEVEDLLDSFQERYFEARSQIQQFQAQLLHMETHGAAIHEIERLRLKIKELTSRENGWIKKLVHTLDAYRNGHKKAEGA